MKILLAQAPHRDTFGYSMPPPGLLRLGGELLRQGHAVELEDLAYRLASGELRIGDALAADAAELLLARVGPGSGAAPRIVGLSAMGATLPIALAIMSAIRARDAEVELWLGGPGTGGIDAALIERFACVDAVVRGEGEVTVAELAAARASGAGCAGIAGVTWRASDGAARREREREPLRDLAHLPRCAWELLPPIAAYKRLSVGRDGLVPIDSGRGCVYDCSFCTIGRFWSRRSRTLPAARLADEIAELSAMPGARSAYLCHDIFGANRGQALALCAELERRALGIPWEVRARADHLDRELLQAMGAAGCYRVLIGVESADAAVREQNQKGMRAELDMLRVVQDCADAGLTPILSLILGLPGEDERALRASLDFCARASLCAGVQLSLHLVNPQPGCALGEEHGARARPVADIAPDMALGVCGTAPERELVARHPDLFSTFALLPQPEEQLRDLHAIATTLPELLMRRPRTFALLRSRSAPHQPIGGANASQPSSLDTLDLYRAWTATGRSFETFARSFRDPVIDELLLWEQAQVRAAARASLPAPPASAPRAIAEVIACEHDLPRVCDALRAGREVEAPRAPCWLAVAPTARGYQTTRVSRDVAQLLAGLDGTRSRAALARAHPGIDAALERLAQAGLVELGGEPAAEPAIEGAHA